MIRQNVARHEGKWFVRRCFWCDDKTTQVLHSFTEFWGVLAKQPPVIPTTRTFVVVALWFHGQQNVLVQTRVPVSGLIGCQAIKVNDPLRHWMLNYIPPDPERPQH